MATRNHQYNRGPQRGGHQNAHDRRPQAEPYMGAPFGFVPLSEAVVEPAWLTPRRLQGVNQRVAAPPVHDVPFEDGVCGTLALRIDAETPIFTRDPQDRQRFFKLPDGRYAIPGTAIKGALRNIVEIAAFGRMDRVNDHRYAVRDLQNPALYTRFMADLRRNPATGQNEPTPLVEGGWLQRRAGADGKGWVYQITPCDFAKIEYEPLERLASQRGVRGFDPGTKQSAVNKYTTWGNASRDVHVQVEVSRPRGQEFLTNFGLAALQGGRPGTLVFTGQPSHYRRNPQGGRRRGTAKHHDFVFLRDCAYPPVDVPARVFSDFEFAHSDRGQQNNLGRSETPNVEWGFWKQQLAEGKPVPVFFLRDTESRQVSAFGLAMMFRLPYRYSIHDAVRHVQQHAFDTEHGIDLASGIFGTVPFRETPAGGPMLRGRVSVGHALAHGDPREDQMQSVILGQPSASYYPLYVEQTHTKPSDPKVPWQPVRTNAKPDYRTWQDDKVRPRGWKRYRPLTRVFIPRPPTNAQGETKTANVETKFVPLRAGVSFLAPVAVHNLRPMELGALLWALDFGGNPSARHMLGYARPLGFGRCRMSLESADLMSVRGETLTPNACVERFVQWMEEQCGGRWASSPQIRELIALAQPVEPEKARYQRLDPGAGTNEFVDAKKEGLKLAASRDARGEASIESTLSTASATGGPRGGHAGASALPLASSQAAAPLSAHLEDTPEARIRAAQGHASLLGPGNAASEMEAQLSRFGTDEEKKAYLEAAVKWLTPKWLHGRADKPWMQKLAPEFERLGVTY